MALQISDSVVWQETAEGISLYHTETGDFRTLNQTGTQIWRLVDSEGVRERIVTRLTGEFAGTNAGLAQRIRTDVLEFIGAMVDAGLIHEAA